MNPFTALPPKVRVWIYYGITVLGLVLGAFQIGYGDGTEPQWLVVALKVLPFLASGFGATAASHTVTKARRISVEPVQVSSASMDAIANQVVERQKRDARGRFA